MPPPLIAAVGVGLGAAAAGASTAAAIGWGILAGAATFLLTPNQKLNSTSSLSPIDVGIGFSPFPTYPSNETPVPILFGRAKVNCPVVHKRAYGSNYDRAHFIAVISEVGTTPGNVTLDDTNITDFPNYYLNTGGVQNEESTWYNVYPQGGEATMILNNSGQFGVGLSTNQVEVLSIDFPIVFYGGGYVTVEMGHSWGSSGSSQSWYWEFVNVDEPSERVIGATMSGSYNSEVDTGKLGGDEPVAGSTISTQAIQSPKFRPGSRWLANIHILTITGNTDGATIGCRIMTVVDNAVLETVRINAAFVHVHIRKQENLASDNPNIAVEGSVATISGTGGNPADALFSFLTDPVRGLGLPSSRIDYTSVLDMVYWCESQGLQFNRAYGQFYDYDTVVKEMTAAGRIMLLNEDGFLTMRPDKPELTSYIVDETEIVPGSISISMKSAITPNRVEVQYVEPYYGYTTQRLPIEGIEQAGQFGLQTTTLDLAGVTDQRQAFQIGYITLQQLLQCPFQASMNVGINTIRRIRVGQVIEVDSTTNTVLNNLKWRIFSIQETEPHVYAVNMVQYKDEVYDVPEFTPWYFQTFDIDSTRSLIANGWPGPQIGPAAVAGLTITNVTYPNDDESELTVTWIMPTERADSIRLQVNWNDDIWDDVGVFVSGPAVFRVPIHYAKVTVRAITNYNGANNEAAAPQAGTYVTGTFDPDYSDAMGFGAGQFNYQPFGY